jgi:hypothetical protein
VRALLLSALMASACVRGEAHVTLKGARLVLEVPSLEKPRGAALVSLGDRALERFAAALRRPLPRGRLFAAFYRSPEAYRAASARLAQGRFANHAAFSSASGSHLRWSRSVESALLHELSHQLLLQQLESYARLPGWLVEGFSDALAERTLAELHGIDALALPEYASKLARCRDMIDREQWIPLDRFLGLGIDAWKLDDAEAHQRHYAQSFCVARYLADGPLLAHLLALPVEQVRRAFEAWIGAPREIDRRIASWVPRGVVP